MKFKTDNFFKPEVEELTWETFNVDKEEQSIFEARIDMRNQIHQKEIVKGYWC